MKLFRTMLTTAVLLVLAKAASAQALSAVALQAFADAEQQQFAPQCQMSACPMFGQNSWVGNLLQHSMTSWQRLSAVCGRGEAVRSFNGVGIAVGSAAKGSCVAGPDCVKGGSAADAQKCCCAKDCACCESCAAPKVVAVPKPVFGFRIETCPLMPGMAMPPGGYQIPYGSPPQHAQTWLAPTPQALPTPQFMTNQRVIALPTSSALPTPPFPYQVVRSAPVAITSAPTQAHLVTADFDARCERMTHRGDIILLEGSVRLVCMKQGRHMLVEAQRVMLNVREGTFTVESDARPVQPSLLRTSAVEPQHPGVTVIAVPVR